MLQLGEAIGGILAANFHRKHRDTVKSGPGAVAAERAKNLAGTTGCLDPARIENNDEIRKPRDFLDRMGNVVDRHGEFVAQPFDKRQNFELALHVERGKRLVEE